MNFSIHVSIISGFKTKQEFLSSCCQTVITYRVCLWYFMNEEQTLLKAVQYCLKSREVCKTMYAPFFEVIEKYAIHFSNLKVCSYFWPLMLKCDLDLAGTGHRSCVQHVNSICWTYMWSLSEWADHCFKDMERTLYIAPISDLWWLSVTLTVYIWT